MKNDKSAMPDTRLRIEGPPIERVFTEAIATLEFCNSRFYAFHAALIACSTINAIGSFLLVESGKASVNAPNNERFSACIERYFPDKYFKVASQLWKSLRCALTHALTVGPDIVISCRDDRRKLHLTELDGWLFVSMPELVNDLSEAIRSYMRDLETNTEFQAKLKLRLQLEARAGKP